MLIIAVLFFSWRGPIGFESKIPALITAESKTSKWATSSGDEINSGDAGTEEMSTS